MSKKQMIEFYMPTRKGGRFPEPFARTTEGEDFLIRSMAETGMTVRKAIRVLRADVKCRKVLVELAKSGYAEYPLSECILH